MKTTLFISSVLAIASLVLKTNSSQISFAAYKPTETKRLSPLLPIAPIKIIVSKSNYELSVYDAKGWYATYPVVFGNSSLADKKYEGDRNTPEGTFKIVVKKIHEKWDRFLGIDYPTKETLDKFNDWKRRGLIPHSAKPGGGIGIHGTWPHEDFVVDRYNNWTNGCISLKREDVEDLYTYVPIGTPITIQK
ncbi:MAG: L,D-transpeptidase family protein [Flavisolibacter sp.]